MAGYPPAATMPPYPFSDLLVLDFAYFLDELRIGVESSVRERADDRLGDLSCSAVLVCGRNDGSSSAKLLKHFTTLGPRRDCVDDAVRHDLELYVRAGAFLKLVHRRAAGRRLTVLKRTAGPRSACATEPPRGRPKGRRACPSR